MPGALSSSVQCETTPVPATAEKDRFVHLDFVRGVAALLVAAGHLRAFWFVDLKFLPHHTPVDGLFYGLSSLGNQAVIIFFVLSGFFVGGSVLSARAANRWSWKHYAFNRLSRLWVVLIPALCFTLAVDSLGLALTHGSGYDGRFKEYVNLGPHHAHGLNLDASTFVGNVFFLQGVATPTYGTNGPLWSLAYEFWYYLLFPVLVATVYPGNTCRGRIFNGILLILIGFMLPRGLLEGGVTWLLGVGAYLVSDSKHRYARFCQSLGFLTFSSLALVASLIMGRVAHYGWGDTSLVVAFALMIPGLTKLKTIPKAYTWLALRLSDMSYTLYLFHFPVLCLLYFTWMPKAKHIPSPSSDAGYGACLLGVLLMSYGLWWLFERRTPAVKRFFKQWLRFG